MVTVLLSILYNGLKVMVCISDFAIFSRNFLNYIHPVGFDGHSDCTIAEYILSGLRTVPL